MGPQNGLSLLYSECWLFSSGPQDPALSFCQRRGSMGTSLSSYLGTHVDFSNAQDRIVQGCQKKAILS